jgi:hypothetical protein
LRPVYKVYTTFDGELKTGADIETPGGAVFHLSAWTKRGLKRKVKRKIEVHAGMYRTPFLVETPPGFEIPGWRVL